MLAEFNTLLTSIFFLLMFTLALIYVVIDYVFCCLSQVRINAFCYSLSYFLLLFLHQVTVKEPQTPDDSAAVVLLTVSRSEGGRGAVKVLWILEEAARYDLTPLNGTLHFNEVFLILN